MQLSGEDLVRLDQSWRRQEAVAAVVIIHPPGKSKRMFS